MDRDNNMGIGCSLLLILVLGIIWFGISWYQAGVQAKVYHRQGVEMSQWEIFTGAKPAERTINVKP
jgi:hypothetical protein